MQDDSGHGSVQDEEQRTEGGEEAREKDLPEEEKAAPGGDEEAVHEKLLKETKEKMLRIAADFDNYKKRMQREIQDREERARAEALKAVLPTVDNLHRAVEQSKQAKDMDSILSGIEIAEKNFLDTLGKLGVIRLESRGKAFDPSYHEAVAQQESEDVPAGTVMDEVQPGYLLGDKLLRAALVLVSRGKPKKKEEEKEKEGEEGSAAGPEDGEAESDNVD